MEANPNPLNEQVQQQQQLIINEDQEQVQQQQQQLIINEDQEQVPQQQLIINEDQEQSSSSDEEEEDVNVSKRIYVLDEIDPHPLRCNLCPESTFTYPKGIKQLASKGQTWSLQVSMPLWIFLYFTDQDRERHKSDRHPKAPKQKKFAKKRKKAATR